MSRVDGEDASDQIVRRCEEIEEQELDIHTLAAEAPGLRSALTALVRAWGVDPIRLNTVHPNWLAPKAGDASCALPIS